MKKDMLVYVKDILDSMVLIEKYVKGINYKDFEKYIEHQDAVMRRFEIIGEAATRLTEEYRKNYPNVPWKSIIGLRNIIIHDYSSVKLKEIWRIATVDLPKTRKDVELLITT